MVGMVPAIVVVAYRDRSCRQGRSGCECDETAAQMGQCDSVEAEFA
jgi:hypothetical protein